MGLLKIFSFFVLLLCMLFLGACEKAVKYQDIPAYGALQLSVKDTLLDTAVIASKLFFNQRAFHLMVQDLTGRNPSSSSPVIFNIYKYYDSTATRNIVCRIFGGGVGFLPGDVCYYQNTNGKIDTLIYRSTLDTVLITGTHDKNRFSFEVAPLFNLSGGPLVFSGGREGQILRDPLVRGGGLFRWLKINNGALYTADNRVQITARFSTAGIDSISYIRYSAQTSMSFDELIAIDSLLRHIGLKDSLFVRLNDSLKIRIQDSVVMSNAGIPQGRFGGLLKVKADSVGLSKLFNTVKSDNSSSIPGDSGWFTVSKQDILPIGRGEKWIYLYNTKWGIPLSRKIDIQPYNIEVLLDDKKANVRKKGAEKENICLLDNQIPFIVNIFGDTTFDDEVWVWIATRNCGESFIDQAGMIKNSFIDQNAHSFLGSNVPWPDAILETQPQCLHINKEGYAGILNASASADFYESKYRISPMVFWFYNYTTNEANFDFYDIKDFRFQNNEFLSQSMAKGSILGYSEASLGNFNGQDSVLANIGGSKLVRKPLTGWFEVEPLKDISSDSTFSPLALINKFGSKYGVNTLDELIPSLSASGARKFYSIYSAYLYTPSLPSFTTSFFDTKQNKGIKLYKNPMRSLPYFINSSMFGAKEFVICAYGRGKYFKEPRAMISTFSSNKRYFWDKTPPAFSWDSATSTLSSHYAPIYVQSNYTFKQTDLSLTLVPYVFDVWLSAADPTQNIVCSLRDRGFGKITSVSLCFNYSGDLQNINPITGERQYRRTTMKIDLPSSFYETQSSQAIGNVVFKNIDARQWQGGVWDMWIETEDDLQNKGVGPFMTSQRNLSAEGGSVSVRQIKIR